MNAHLTDLSANESSVDAERRFGALRRLYGDAGYQRLRRAHVAVVGLGGVGSWTVEALARSGVAALTLIDFDHVAESNINRQVQALDSTIGMAKGDALRERIAGIHPGCAVTVVDAFVEAGSARTPGELGESGNWPALLGDGAVVDAVVDACDDSRAKRVLAEWALAQTGPLKTHFVTVGAAGGKRQPQATEVADLAEVTHDPLLSRLRAHLRKVRGLPAGQRIGLPCVFSREPVLQPAADIGADAGIPACTSDGSLNCHGYGSSVAVTAGFGMAAAAWAINAIVARRSNTDKRTPETKAPAHILVGLPGR